MAVYVDDCFVEGDWGRWNGGGHLQADTEAELHAFAQSIGLKRSWFQGRPKRPEMSHYDLTASKRDEAIFAGAIPEAVEDGTARRKAARQLRQAHLRPDPEGGTMDASTNRGGTALTAHPRSTGDCAP